MTPSFLNFSQPRSVTASSVRVRTPSFLKTLCSSALIVPTAAATGSGDLGIRHAFAAEDGDLALAWRQRRERREDRFAGNRKVWTAASFVLEGDQKTWIG